MAEYKLENMIYIDVYDKIVADIVDENGEEFGIMSCYTDEDLYETLVVTVYEDGKERSVEVKYDSELKEDQLEVETNLIIEDHFF